MPLGGPRLRSRSRSAWGALVPAVALVVGLLFATSANVSRGADLRSAGTDGLVGLVRSEQGQVVAGQAAARRLDAAVRAETDAAATSNSGVAAAQRRGRGLAAPAGLTALSGPGLIVTLDDAHAPPADPSIDVNETIVHQSDLQAVVNALWAGGAEAVSIAGQRVIATSAVRCVGSTLLLNGQVYSPPFRLAAIGPATRMRDALARSRGVGLYRQAAAVLGLTYSVRTTTPVRVPSYDGALATSSARVLRR